MSKLAVAAIVALCLIVGGFLVLNQFGKDQIDEAKAKSLVKSGALLLDVRTVEEFNDGHIANAVNIPVGELERRIEELGPKNQTIVLYCRSGMRSSRAASMLKASGRKDVHDMGPMSKWSK